MIYAVPTYNQNVTVRFSVQTRKPEMIRIKARHPRMPYTYYTDRWNTVNGIKQFYIKIPRSPNKVIIDVYNESKGNVQYDNSFRVIGDRFELLPNNPILASYNFQNATVNSFIEFTEDFSEKAGIISAQNSIYVSPDGRFKVNYVDEIRNDDGKILTTPARVNGKTGIIQIAAKYFRNYTVPGRKGTMYHEFSHLWRNVNPSDEIEADKNMLMLYLGTGNPTIDAYNVWFKIFNNAPSDGNVKRYIELDKFIKNFHSEMATKLNS